MIELPRLKLVFLGFCLALAAGCTDSRGGPIAYDKTLSAPDAPTLATLETDYKIAPMDKLAVKVFKAEDLSGDSTVAKTARRFDDRVAIEGVKLGDQFAITPSTSDARQITLSHSACGAPRAAQK